MDRATYQRQASSKLTTYTRGVQYGLIAAVVYFFIAMIANRAESADVILKVSLMHSLFCFAMTFFSATMMEFFFNIPEKPEHKYWFSALASGSISLTVMIVIHLLIKTPEIVSTVASSALTSIPYYLLLPLKLLREFKKPLKNSYRSEKNWEKHWKVKTISGPYEIKDFLTVLKYNLTRVSNKNYEFTKFIPNRHINNQIQPALKIGFLGDLMPMYQCKWAPSEEILNFFGGIDYLICNFEGLLTADKSVLLGQNHSLGILNSISEIISPEKTVLSVANNHSADSGYQPFLNHIRLLSEKGFKVIGKRDDASVMLGGEVNLVACTEWSNQPHGYLSFLEHACIHYNSNAKMNILFPHWGHELELFPRPENIQRAQNLLKKWDAVVGHHSHVPGPVASYNAGRGNQIVAFSLGDSATGLPRRRYRNGIALTLEVGPSPSGIWKVGESNWCYTTLEPLPGKIRKFRPMSFDEALKKGMAYPISGTKDI